MEMMDELYLKKHNGTLVDVPADWYKIELLYNEICPC